MTQAMTEQVVRAVASAYGYTPCGRKRSRAEQGGGDGAGLAICVPMEAIARAGKALATGRDGRPRDPELRTWWESLSDKNRQQVSDWDSGQFRQNGRGVAYRVRQFKHWKRAAGIEISPIARPRLGPLLALSMARAAGMPVLLEEWLLCVALQDTSRWALVALAMEATGFDAWAAEEAGYSIVFGSQGRIRDRAKLYGLRAETYSRLVDDARSVLLRWLDKAAQCLAAQAESDDQASAGNAVSVT